MSFDTLNVCLMGLAVLLLVLAVYRAQAFKASIPPPKPRVGF
jgi:hypothetical protein